MGYDNNNGGCCNGGWGFPFGGFGNMGGFGFDALILLLFFGLMGGGMWGGMGGWGMGGMGWGGGAGMLGATSLAATETAALINQQNTADRVAAANAKADAIAGIVTANGTKLEMTKDAVFENRYQSERNLCQLGNNIAQQFNAQTMQGMNMHNATTALLNDMRAEQAKCCCESKYQAAADKCELLGAISASEQRILAQLNADKYDRMQEKLAAANERIATLKAERDNSQQTQTLLAAIQSNGCAPKCQPCGPCGPYTGGYAYTPYPCAPCMNSVQRAVDGALETRFGEILFPTTPAAATA